MLERLEDRTVLSAPSLAYSSYLPGIGYAAAADSSGNLYVTGNAGSGMATTPGAFQTSGSGVFVAKLSPTTNQVIYATYLGTNDSNASNVAGVGIAVDAAGDAYVTGIAGSSFPTTSNAAFPTTNATYNGFFAELNPSGSGLIYSTYLPNAATNADVSLGEPGGIAVDSSGNAYLTGAAVAGLPTTSGAFQTSFQSTSTTNAYFAKIDPNLSGQASLVYATYLGGTGQDQGTSIAIDGAGKAYVAGDTTSTNFPTTAGAFQTAYSSRGLPPRPYSGTAVGNAFVAKLDPSLSGSASLVYSTYLGVFDGYVSELTAVIDVPTEKTGPAIAVNSSGNAYVAGATNSILFPTTSGAFQTSPPTPNGSYHGGDENAFVSELNATGSGLVYSTYLGGNDQDGAFGLALDSQGNAYVTGWTRSTTFPTVNPIQAHNAGGTDAWNAPAADVFVTAVNSSGSGLLFSTYLGDTNNDFGNGSAIDSANNIYVLGETSSSSFPTTAGAWQSAGSGFVSKITAAVAPAGSLGVTGFPSAITAGAAGTVTVTAESASGGTNTGYAGTVHFTSSDPQAVLPADYTFTTADQGTHTFAVTLDTAGTQSIAVTDATNSFTGSQTGITVTPAAASTFRLTGYPSPTNAGLAGNFTATALDPYGNLATGYAGTVHFSSSDPLAVLPADYTFTGADQGVHTFTATLKKAGTQSLTATDTATGSIAGSQAGIAVKPAAASTFSISAPASVTHGVAFTITVTALDAYGNVATGYTGKVHFTSSDGTAILPANYTFTANDAGVHTFVNKTTLKKRGTQTVTITDSADGLAASVSINVV
jgi:hypothetical protein